MAANGRVPLSDLIEVQAGIYLEPVTARAWRDMVLAAHAEERMTLAIATPYGGYRDLAAQRAIYRAGSASGIAVAKPGSSSHGFGTRVDVAGFAGIRRTWVRANAHRFGFSFEFGTADPNHLEHTPIAPDPIPVPPKNGSNMTTLYQKQGVTPSLFALAGDSPGTPANWLETQTQALANQWAVQVGGPAAQLSAAQFDAWKADYLAPLAVAGGSGGSGLTAAEHNQLFDIANKGELGQALTSTVALVNEHADENTNVITAKIDNLTLSAG